MRGTSDGHAQQEEHPLSDAYADYRCPGCGEPRPIVSVKDRRRLDGGGKIFHSRECQKRASSETRPCNVCQTPVTRRRSEFSDGGAYCPEHRGMHRLNRQTYTCDNPTCTNDVERTPANAHGAIYCSRTCSGAAGRKADPVTVRCAGCEIVFAVKGKARIQRVNDGKPVYHNRECQKAASRIELRCTNFDTCNNTVWRYRTQLSKSPDDRPVRVFCDPCIESGQDARRRRTGTTEPCGICGKPVYRRPVEGKGEVRYCSTACRAESLRGPRVERQTRDCIVCETAFTLTPQQVLQDVKTCSRECTAVTRRRKPGERYIDPDGYAWITTPDGRNMGEHRYKMEVLLADVLKGEPLPKGANVHHVNGNRSDNSTDGALSLGPEGRWRSGNLELWVTSQPSGQRLVDLIQAAVLAELEEYRRRFGSMADVAEREMREQGYRPVGELLEQASQILLEGGEHMTAEQRAKLAAILERRGIQVTAP